MSPQKKKKKIFDDRSWGTFFARDNFQREHYWVLNPLWSKRHDNDTYVRTGCVLGGCRIRCSPRHLTILLNYDAVFSGLSYANR